MHERLRERRGVDTAGNSIIIVRNASREFPPNEPSSPSSFAIQSTNSGAMEGVENGGNEDREGTKKLFPELHQEFSESPLKRPRKIFNRKWI